MQKFLILLFKKRVRSTCKKLFFWIINSEKKIVHLNEIRGVRFEIRNAEDILVAWNKLPELSERRQGSRL